MTYMIKPLEDISLKQPDKLSIRSLEKRDIEKIVQAFQSMGWNKPSTVFEHYLNEAHAQERFNWIAFLDSQFAGYVTLKVQSHYPHFRAKNIPEIMDLNVLPAFRNQGIGSALLDKAEGAAANLSNVVGIGVGLYGGEDGGYGPAQRIYVKRGYSPDGNGVTYNYQRTTPGNSYALDDDLVLWFTKSLVKSLDNS